MLKLVRDAQRESRSRRVGKFLGVCRLQHSLGIFFYLSSFLSSLLLMHGSCSFMVVHRDILYTEPGPQTSRSSIWRRTWCANGNLFYGTNCPRCPIATVVHAARRAAAHRAAAHTRQPGTQCDAQHRQRRVRRDRLPCRPRRRRRLECPQCLAEGCCGGACA